MTKATISTENLKKATLQHKNDTKTSITQRLLTNLEQSVEVTSAIQLVLLTVLKQCVNQQN